MKLKFYQQFFAKCVFVAILAIFAMSCNNFSNKNSKSKVITQTHEFPNTNWAFEEEVLNFDFDIVDTTKDYQIALNLKYDTAVVTLKNIPISITLKTPDGMQSIAASKFDLERNNNNKISMQNGTVQEANVVVFPKRRFKAIGNYKLSVYRRAQKADNYGFIELSSQVTPL